MSSQNKENTEYQFFSEKDIPLAQKLSKEEWE